MIIKGITYEDFVNYKLPSMFIAMPSCTFKCDKACGRPVCQNGPLASAPDFNVPIESIVQRYIGNTISKAVVFGGLEPFDSADALLLCIERFRVYGVEDDIVIYTGYNKDEIDAGTLRALKDFGNIIIKYGRFVPDQQPHLDEVLGVSLASDNQYAERL